jgi:hypothetical protein
VNKEYLINNLGGTELNKKVLCDLFSEISKGNVYKLSEDRINDIKIDEYVHIDKNIKFKIFTTSEYSILIKQPVLTFMDIFNWKTLKNVYRWDGEKWTEMYRNDGDK